jgi:dTDP-4-dehydrorhamnose 3,5-epimerase-like enzyme
MKQTSIKDIRVIDFQVIENHEGALTVISKGDHIPFDIERFFNVRVKKPCTRGKHGHRNCHQFLITQQGNVEYVIKDGVDETRLRLKPDVQGLWVPPGLWVELNFKAADNAIGVFCDLPYDEADYLRDWQEYLAYKKTPLQN